MENTSDRKGAQSQAAGEGRKSTPYQRIVIACPENHIIVVKRFSNGGKNAPMLFIKDSGIPHFMVVCFCYRSQSRRRTTCRC